MTVYIRKTYHYEAEDAYGLFSDCNLLMMARDIDYLLSYAECMGYCPEEVIICKN